jgi:hypothetical protein
MLVFLILLAAGLGGYLLANGKKVKSVSVDLNTTPAVTVVPTVVATISPESSQSATPDISSWKTYRTNGYSVQYPNTWLLMSTTGLTQDSHNAIWIFNPATMKDEYGNGGNTGRQIPSQFITIDQLISAQTPKQYVNAVSTSIPSAATTMDRKQINVGGFLGESYVEPGEGSRGRIIVISNGSALFLFNISVNDPNEDAIINKILSTFLNK